MMKLRQVDDNSPMMIWGYMKQLPYGKENSHGFSFNTAPFNGRDCSSTDGHFNPFDEPHGEMNMIPSMVGDLTSINDTQKGYANYGTEKANRPSLFVGGMRSVVGRSMAVYGNPDIYYTGMPEHGPIIACCNIRVFKVLVHNCDKCEKVKHKTICSVVRAPICMVPHLNNGLVFETH